MYNAVADRKVDVDQGFSHKKVSFCKNLGLAAPIANFSSSDENKEDLFFTCFA